MMKLYEFETNFSTHIFCFLARVRTLSFLYGRLMSFFFFWSAKNLSILGGCLNKKLLLFAISVGFLVFCVCLLFRSKHTVHQ